MLRIPKVLERRLNQPDNAYNCWGATQKFFQPRQNKLHWADENEMKDWLETYTVKCNPKKHNIVAIYDNEGLIHTAVHIGQGKYYHKRGSYTAEIAPSINEVLDTYSGHVEYRLYAK